MLKVLIGILLLGTLISLFSGLVFLVKDDSSRHRTVNALAVRITLSTLLVLLVIWGLWTGELGLRPTP